MLNSAPILANPLSGTRAVFKKPKKQNMAALRPEELPKLMVAIANASIKRTRCLIEWQLHTMTRTAEAATTYWADIDLDKKTWTIPAERMKKRRAHVIPLTEHALALLETIKPYSGHREYVFPADRDPRDHCNSQTANMALKRMGFEGRLVSHSMRSMASTILNEQGWDPELIEVALAHVDKYEVRSACNRADYIERRRPMTITKIALTTSAPGCSASATPPTVSQDPQVQQAIGKAYGQVYPAEAAQAAYLARFGDDAEVERQANIAAELESAQAQVAAVELVLRATSDLFNTLGASGTGKQLDRHWRNARTASSHNPVIYKKRIIGDWHVNGTEPPYVWHIGGGAKQG